MAYKQASINSMSKEDFLETLLNKLRRKKYDVQAKWRSQPVYQKNRPGEIIETRIAEGNDVFIMHHELTYPLENRNIKFILDEYSSRYKGMSERDINLDREYFGNSTIKEKGYWSIVDNTLIPAIKVPIGVYDILRNRHLIVTDRQMTLSYDKTNKLRMVSNTRCDGKGIPKPIKISGGLAELLKAHPMGVEIANNLVKKLQDAMDETPLPYDKHPILVDELSAEMHDIQWKITGHMISLVEYETMNLSFSGNVIATKVLLPEQILTATQGKKIKDIIEGLTGYDDVLVKIGTTRKSPRPHSAFQLDVKAVELSKFIQDINQRA